VNPLIFREYDMSGLITGEEVFLWGRALGTYLGVDDIMRIADDF
jgi:hypothetical protein